MSKKVSSALREKMKKAADEGVRQSQANTDYKPTSYVTYYEWPDGAMQWIPKGDDKGIKHFIDMVPFPVGEKFPDGVWPNPEAIRRNGFWHVLDLFYASNCWSCQ